MKQLLLILVFVVCGLTGNAQAYGHSSLKDFFRLTAYSKRYTDAFASSGCPVALARVRGIQAGVQVSRPFMLKELSHYLLALNVPAKTGGFGLTATYYGSPAFNETGLGLGYARSLWPDVHLGVRFHYQAVRLAYYGRDHSPGYSVALQVDLTDRFQAGFQISSSVAGKTNTYKYQSTAAAGFGYDVSDRLYIAIELLQQKAQPLNVVAGLLYAPLATLQLRAGISTAAAAAWFGTGFTLKKMRVIVTANWHPQLSFTPGFAMELMQYPEDNEEAKSSL